MKLLNNSPKSFRKRFRLRSFLGCNLGLHCKISHWVAKDSTVVKFMVSNTSETLKQTQGHESDVVTMKDGILAISDTGKVEIVAS